MRFRLRGRWKFGPLYINHSKYRPTSWGIDLGFWSYNVTRRTSTIDTPGPGGFTHQHGRKRSAR